MKTFIVLLPLCICLVSGIAIGWSLAQLRSAKRVLVRTVKVPPAPAVPVIDRADGSPLSAEDLVGIRYLLEATSQRWLRDAFDQVVERAAAEEASEGLDDALARMRAGATGNGGSDE